MIMGNTFTLDFETEAIQSRPKYPPRPVGMAIQEPGKKSKYWSWGHPSGNNCSFDDAENELRRLSATYSGFIAHHLKFDWCVWLEHFPKITPPPIENCHCTMILAFLDNHHARKLDLKTLSVVYLGRPADERDDLKEWITANVPEAMRAKSQWGAYISRAPGAIVSPYARADAEMTDGIFKILHKNMLNGDMGKAYLRELKLIPILLTNEKEGIRVDLPALEKDIPLCEKSLEAVDAWVGKYLKAPSDFNIDSNEQLADALEGAGIVKDWILTEKGQRATNKKALKEMVGDQLLLAALEYRAAVATFTGTFLKPWREVAIEADGWTFPNWNSTKQEEGGGTRTGRISASPNYQNIPSIDNYNDMMTRLTEGGLFKSVKGLTPLPRCRNYILADSSKHVMFGRDFDGQELRVLGHYEDADICRLYNDNPNADVHQYGSDKILELTGHPLMRKKVKIIVFTVVYGGGVATLMERLDTDSESARGFKNALLKVFPGIKQLGKDLERRARAGEPIRSWGGRILLPEEPRVIKGQLRDFYYKLLNLLIQGSSSDITKEAMIRYDETRKDSRLMLTVHDELQCCGPKKCWKAEMKILKEAMNGIELDVPMLSKGEVGASWGEMQKCP